MAQGSIQKHVAKDGVVSWRVRTDERNPATGRRRQPMHTFKTKREAEAFRAQRHTDIERGVAVDPSKLTVGEYLANWLETCAKPSIRPSTYASYESLIRVRVLPSIGAVPLQKLTVLQVQRLYTELLNGRRVDGKAGPLSNRTVRYVHTVLKMAFKQAARWRLVPYNVVADTDPPKSVRPQIEAWNSHEARAFLDVAEDDTYAPIWTIALHTGLRKGELLALQWLDIDLDRAVLHVRRNVVETRNGYVFGEPKTKAGRRTVNLSLACVDVLRQHRAARIGPIQFDPTQRDTALVFQSTAGTLIDQRNLTTRFDSLVRDAGVKRITFHGMRHTYATLCLAAGVHVKAVSAILGHASIAITLDTYAHLLPRMEEHAAEAIEQALSARA